MQPRSESRGCVVEVASHHFSSSSSSGSAPFFQFSDATRRSVGWRQPSVLRVPSYRARPVSRPRNPLIRSFSLLFSLYSSRRVFLPTVTVARSFAIVRRRNGGRDETRGCGGRASISRIPLDFTSPVIHGDTTIEKSRGRATDAILDFLKILPSG